MFLDNGKWFHVLKRVTQKMGISSRMQHSVRDDGEYKSWSYIWLKKKESCCITHILPLKINMEVKFIGGPNGSTYSWD